jgi:hypothetical protein
MFFRPEIFFKNNPIRANFMRGIDCAHFQRFLNPESESVYWNENRKFLDFLPENDFLGVILCEESIARIPEAWKRALDSGK